MAQQADSALKITSVWRATRERASEQKRYKHRAGMLAYGVRMSNSRAARNVL